MTRPNPRAARPAAPAAPAPLLVVPLDPKAGRPLHRQLYDGLREAIHDQPEALDAVAASGIVLHELRREMADRFIDALAIQSCVVEGQDRPLVRLARVILGTNDPSCPSHHSLRHCIPCDREAAALSPFLDRA
jgi:hypothetical protein